MAYAFNNGVRIGIWRDLRSCMARHFRTIVYDNRGVGKSDIWLWPFSISAMARDAVCVMDAAGISPAHAFGMSMGGMIAQELALLFPNRIRRLVLGCTTRGGRKAVHADREARRALLPLLFAWREKRIAALLPFLYDEHTSRDRVEGSTGPAAQSHA